MPPALAQIKDILAFGQSKLVSKEEMSALLAVLTRFIKDYKEVQIKEIQALHKSVEAEREEIGAERKEMQEMMKRHLKQMEKSHSDMMKRMSEMREEIVAFIPAPVDISSIESQLTLLQAKPEPKVPTMDEMKMHALIGLSVADIAGLEERLKQLDRMARGGGGRLLGGVLNVGMRVETPEGTVNGTNVTFTAFKEPKRVIGDGAVYYAGQGYTYSGKTITMDIAPVRFIRSEY